MRATIFLKFNTFFYFILFFGFVFKFLNIVASNQNKNKKKKPKFEQDVQKELLNGCSSTLEFFLVKYIYILFWSADNIFSILTKNALQIFKLEK